MQTVAGNGARAYGGDNVTATAAYLGNPHDVAVDSQGRVILPTPATVACPLTDGTLRRIAGTTLPWDGGEGALG
ncbi:MAG: hypothetical protein R3E79_45415 [Caldilineaceae bacterium]